MCVFVVAASVDIAESDTRLATPKADKQLVAGCERNLLAVPWACGNHTGNHHLCGDHQPGGFSVTHPNDATKIGSRRKWNTVKAPTGKGQSWQAKDSKRENLKYYSSAGSSTSATQKLTLIAARANAWATISLRDFDWRFRCVPHIHVHTCTYTVPETCTQRQTCLHVYARAYTHIPTNMYEDTYIPYPHIMRVYIHLAYTHANKLDVHVRIHMRISTNIHIAQVHRIYKYNQIHTCPYRGFSK